MTHRLFWPLADSPFTLLDKAKISWWILSQDRYTMGAKVAELEKKFGDLSGSNALMVANGSIANHLVFELWKVKNPGVKPVVIVPAVTWISSVTPAMMAGMDIEFCDVNLNDFSFDYSRLQYALERLQKEGRRVIVWPTALIGWSPNMRLLQQLADQYGAELFLDACENTLANAMTVDGPAHILRSAKVVTTSCYLSHYVCSVEGGFVFFRDKADFDLAKMFRNHGMSRSLPAGHVERVSAETFDLSVDPKFLFALPGTNYRASDVHAQFGLMDFNRVESMKTHRLEIYREFSHRIDRFRYYLPQETGYHAPFCLSIFSKRENLPSIKKALTEAGIESRPIIGSNLLRQPPFRKMGKPEDFPNSEWIHRRGCYVGLHRGVTKRMVQELVSTLDKL